ncbi:Eco29kI family restriction endonuclease [Ideonella oryzae]|uniref:Eco29kI family restriction endonuclease n=1 Tax=Ideonella oryzae TaxID=2937441 RepID=A0ABT1BGJ2_9BURK|nr:Eco29kI family restriction endonuclease [Ideonella oryzae]MCO5975361.1 Eco29kI family restriction endonuclease [Ideonella oryzae]
MAELEAVVEKILKEDEQGSSRAARATRKALEAAADKLTRADAKLDPVIGPVAVKSHLIKLDAVVDKIVKASVGDSPRKVSAARKLIEAAAEKLSQAGAKLDPVIRPDSVFDPTAPVTAGRMIALTLVAQKSYPLARIPVFYGSGVYALYYKGTVKPFPAYEPLKGKDHPIYVGKADPVDRSAKDAIAQGVSLGKRLREHAARIMKVSSTLSIEDFECRFLICQSGFQQSAEAHLIKVFEPIWNSDTKICFGMSKHGDDPGVRGNGRSPWFTMHPGVAWADDEKLGDQKSKAQIEQEIADHFRKKPPYKDIHELFDFFSKELGQFEMPEATAAIPVDADEGIDDAVAAVTPPPDDSEEAEVPTVA